MPETPFNSENPANSHQTVEHGVPWETPELTVMSLPHETLVTLSNVSSDGILFS